jgi:hypothetical protein
MSRTEIQVEGLGKRNRVGQADGHALRLSTMLQKNCFAVLKNGIADVV